MKSKRILSGSFQVSYFLAMYLSHILKTKSVKAVINDKTEAISNSSERITAPAGRYFINLQSSYLLGRYRKAGTRASRAEI